MDEEATNSAKNINVREMQYGGHNAAKTNRQWRANQLWATLSLVLPVTFGILLACRIAVFGSLCRDPFRHKEFRPLFHCFVPFFSILSCDPPLVGLDTESSEVVQKTPRIHSFFCPPPPPPPRARKPHPPRSSPNITHFDSLVSTMRAINPANRIRLLRDVASMHEACRGRNG